MKVIVKDFLNVRVGSPSVNAPCYQYLAPGSEIEVDGVTYTGDFFEASNQWMRDAANNFYWAGGLIRTTQVPDVPQLFYNYNALFKNVSDAMRNSKGEGIKVAVLDSGIYEAHPDLRGAFDKQHAPSADFTSSAFGDEDKNHHGTHVAGLIGARSDDEQGIIGVAPRCTIRNIKVVNDDGISSGNALLMGLREAKRIPVDIINLSLSITFAQYKGIQNFMASFASGTIMVAAAGNNDKLLEDDILFPAMSPHVIAVGAVSKTFIRRNARPAFNKRVDYLFPEIKLSSCSLKERSFYETGSGSSMSAALLTGLIALIMKSSGNKSIAHIKNILDSIAVSYSQQIDSDSITLIKPV